MKKYLGILLTATALMLVGCNDEGETITSSTALEDALNETAQERVLTYERSEEEDTAVDIAVTTDASSDASEDASGDCCSDTTAMEFLAIPVQNKAGNITLYKKVLVSDLVFDEDGNFTVYGVTATVNEDGEVVAQVTEAEASNVSNNTNNETGESYSSEAWESVEANNSSEEVDLTNTLFYQTFGDTEPIMTRLYGETYGAVAFNVPEFVSREQRLREVYAIFGTVDTLYCDNGRTINAAGLESYWWNDEYQCWAIGGQHDMAFLYPLGMTIREAQLREIAASLPGKEDVYGQMVVDAQFMYDDNGEMNVLVTIEDGRMYWSITRTPSLEFLN